MRSPVRAAYAAINLGAFAVAVAGACTGRRAADVASPSLRSVDTARAEIDAATPPRGVPPIAARGLPVRPIASARSRAIALDSTTVYFGDEAHDALLAVDKRSSGAEPRRLARGAPTRGALTYDADDAALTWIASPGDIVLRMPMRGGAPRILRDRGIFTDVAASGGDVFVTEVRGGGGVLTRISGATAARLAAFGGTPRGVAIDRERVYVATSSRIVSTPRTRGAVRELAAGGAFDSPQVDESWLYAVMSTASGRTRSLVRVPKAGGALQVMARSVRDAPIAIARGVVYWFDAERPALVAADARSAPPLAAQVVSLDPLFENVSALAVDDDGIFAAAGTGDGARIVAVTLQ